MCNSKMLVFSSSHRWKKYQNALTYSLFQCHCGHINCPCCNLLMNLEITDPDLLQWQGHILLLQWQVDILSNLISFLANKSPHNVTLAAWVTTMRSDFWGDPLLWKTKYLFSSALSSFQSCWTFIMRTTRSGLISSDPDRNRSLSNEEEEKTYW